MEAEPLEARRLLFAWTAEEVYLAELVNRARSDPMAEAARVGLDLTAGLSAAELARLVTQEPLSLNEFLTLASRAHGLDMAQRDFFDHINPDGLSPSDRAQDAGYLGTAGENIAAGHDDVDVAHRAWLESLGHRKNVLSLHDNFDANFHYDEFGPGFAFTDIGPFFDYYTELFGVMDTAAPYLLGVVFTDGDANNFYGIGEGLGNVRIDVATTGAPGTVVGTYTTDAAGNYQISLPAGSYVVTFTNRTSGLRTTKVATIGTENEKLDALASELTQGTNTLWNSEEGSRVFPASTALGRIAAAARNAGGRPVVFTQNTTGGGWTGNELVGVAGGPEVTGQVVAWVDPKDGLIYAAGRSASGLVLYTNTSGNSWTMRNLTTEVGGAATNVGDQITVFVATDQIVHIAGIESGGDLVLYRQSGAGTAGAYQWAFENMVDNHLTPQGLAMPAWTGEIVSYVTSWNGLNIAGLDPSGAVQVVWWAPGLTMWRADNLSAITGAPAFDGGLTAYLTPWGGINLGGLTGAGEVTVTWWVPGFGADWRTNNLSQLFSGPGLDSVSITSYVSSWGGLNIAGIDSGGRVIIYWWAPGMTDWRVTSISDFIAGAPPMLGRITGLAAANGTLNLFGMDSGEHVVRYNWAVGDTTWSWEDITVAAGG